MFKDLSLLPVYTSDDNDISLEFYNPTLKRAVSYVRTSAYFSARALSMYAEGLENFRGRNCKYRLIISHDISRDDYEEIKRGYKIRSELANQMIGRLSEELSLKEEKNLSNLAYYIAVGTVEIKIAFKYDGIFHDKCGIMKDSVGDMICFRGSNNETVAALDKNYESFQITCSWLDVDGFYSKGIEQSLEEFELLWNNRKEGLVVLSIEESVLREVLKYNKGKLIMDENIIKPNTIVLDFENDQLVLWMNTDGTEWLTKKFFYKLSIKHKVEQITSKEIYFKKNLTYIDFEKIMKEFSERFPLDGYSFSVTHRLQKYINDRKIYIEERAKLGVELKTDAGRVANQYNYFKMIVNKELERQLREKQMFDAFYMCVMKRSCNFSVPGSGKTSSAIAVYSYLRYKNLVDRIVMIGPKNSFGSWIDEFKACFGNKLELDYFSIQDSKMTSVEDKRSILRFDTKGCNLFLFNYESLNNYINEISHIVSERTLLVFDEVHKVKAINGERAKAALEIAKVANYKITMTGTPIPNSYTDIYNLLHILYPDEYKEFFGFDVSYLKNASLSDINTINNKLQPFFCRTTKKDLSVPEPNPDITVSIDVSNAEQQLFEIISKKYKRNKLALFVRLLQMESNPKMLLDKLDKNDFAKILDSDDYTVDIDTIDFVDYSQDVTSLISQIDVSSKKKECIELVEKLTNENKKTIVWCIFIDSIRSMEKELKKRGIKAECIIGDVEMDERLRIIEAFRGGEIDVLITNPHTLAESVSLHTICHDAIYYEYSYNLVHLLQSKDRIHRLGLPDGQYTQYYYLQDKYKEGFSIDEEIYKRLLHKEQVMLKAIDDRHLEPVYTDEEDLEIILEGLF